MKKKIALVWLLVTFSLNVFSQSSHWLWAKQAFGFNNSEWVQGTCTDVYGNIYLTGILRDTAIFGNDTLITNGNDDVLIAKLDPTGNWLWAKNVGSPYADGGGRIITDADGNIYVLGGFSLAITFGNTTLSAAGSSHLFIAKADQFGNWLWAKNVVSSLGIDGAAFALDNKGYVYFTGYFFGTANFGNTTLTAIGSSNGRDIFVSKMDTSGNWIWSKRAGGSDNLNEIGTSIAVDDSGNVIVAGMYNGSLSPCYFGSIALTSAICWWDTFIAKMDSTGNWLWAKTIGWQGSCSEVFIAGTDSMDNIYLGGNFYGGNPDSTVNFGSLHLTSNSGSNVYVAKMSPAGTWLWVNKATGLSMRSSAKDNENSMFILGYFQMMDTVSIGNIILTQDTSQILRPIAKVDQNGNWVWVQTVFGHQTIYGESITSDALGNIFVAGEYDHQIIFGNDTLNNLSNYFNIYVAKMDTLLLNSVPVNSIYTSAEDLIIYPNPATNQLTIESSTFKVRGVEIWDVMGRRCLALPLNPLKGTSASIDVSKLNPGIYFVKVSGEKEELVGKFVKE